MDKKKTSRRQTGSESTEIKNKNKRIIQTYFVAFTKGIPSAMSKLLADDAVFEIPGPAYSTYTRYIKGKKKIHEFYVMRQKARQNFMKSISSDHLSINAKTYATDDNRVFAEWTCGGVSKDGKTFRASGTNHFHLNDEGKIKNVKIFVNAPLDQSVKSLGEDRLLVADQGRLALVAWAVV